MFEEFDPNDPTAAVFFLDQNAWLLGVVYTKIRAEYPKDFRLIELKIKPVQEQQQEAWGRQTYTVTIEKMGNLSVLVAANRSPSFAGQRDLEFMRDTSGDFDGANACRCSRVDFHYVTNGYYVQIITIVSSRGKASKEETIRQAKSIANQAFTNLSVGEKSGA